MPKLLHRKPPQSFQLAEKEVQVWRASLTPQADPQYVSLLTAEERARADRFHFEHDREHFIQCRGILRILLGRYLNWDPAQVALKANEYGKPEVVAPKVAGPFCFNLSHSHGKAIFLFARTDRAGVDLEKIQSKSQTENIAERYFSDSEVQFLNSFPAQQRQKTFFKLWTLKEAFIKAQGTGLSYPLKDFTITWTRDENISLQTVHSEASDKTWSLKLWEVFPDFQAALALDATPVVFRFWDWELSLAIPSIIV